MSKPTLGLFAAVFVAVFAVACSDAPSAPTPKRQFSAATKSHDDFGGCDPATALIPCDDTGYGPTPPLPNPPIYLTWFQVANCDPHTAPAPTVCTPFCYYNFINCIPQQNDGRMFQLRMSFKRPDGSQIEYDDENLHGDVESMSQQILANSFCNYPDAALSVEVYTLDQPYNRLNRLPAPAGSFWIYAGDNGVFKRYGYGTVWPSLTIRFSWSCR